jgi:hypothetical protein
MSTFKVLCFWTESKIVEIDAETPEAAIQKAMDDVPAEEGEYLDDSFQAELLDEDKKQ